MKNKVCIYIAMLLFAACNNNEKDQRIRQLSASDSTLMQQVMQKDSTITAYINTLNNIQDNLDSIRVKEKILFVKNGEDKMGRNAVADIKAMDEIIIKDNKEINRLQSQLNKMNKKDASLEKMIAHLTAEMTDKENEIIALQSKYAEASDSLKFIISRFNESVSVIETQKTNIDNMTAEMHTVYYAIGTAKELKKHGVISKEGSIIGIGGSAELKKDFNSTYFTKTDMTQLHALPLNNKFVKLVTNHPSNSYRIGDGDKADSLVITDPGTFWANTKYMVVVVK